MKLIRILIVSHDDPVRRPNEVHAQNQADSLMRWVILSREEQRSRI